MHLALGFRSDIRQFGAISFNYSLDQKKLAKASAKKRKKKRKGSSIWYLCMKRPPRNFKFLWTCFAVYAMSYRV
jgi:hypothetical protein